MIELATLNSVVSLFKELIGIIKDRREEERKTFDRVCKPLYEQLGPLAKEYYSIVQDCATRLTEEEVNFEHIANVATARRAAIVLARNGVLGFVHPYFDLPTSGNEFDRLMNGFARAVVTYFYNEGETLSEEQYVLTSRGTELITYYRSIGRTIRATDSRVDVERMKAHTSRALKELETNWIKVSEKYADLKIYCDA
jgi:hypothetical protein